MLRQIKTTIIQMIVLLSFSAIILADSPRQISYQGELFDDAGKPVPDGQYAMQFRLWYRDTGSEPVWDSQKRMIAVTGGLFSYNLGDSVLISPSLFQDFTHLWLSVKIGDDPELTPRTKLTSVGYSFESEHSLISDVARNVNWNKITNMPAGFADGVDDGGGVELAYSDSAYVNIGGDAMAGTLAVPTFEIGFANSWSGRLSLYSSTDAEKVVESWAGTYGGSLRLKGMGGKDFFRLDPDINTGNGGYFAVARNSNNQFGFTVDGNYNATQEPRISITGSSQSVIMDMSKTGDATVDLPEDAINSIELLNEPGVASRYNGSTFVFIEGETWMQDIETIDITTPADGYIVIDAILSVRANGMSGLNLNQTQIDEFGGGLPITGAVVEWGVGGTYGHVDHTITHKKVVYKDAGTYTFRVEGRPHPSNTAGAYSRVWSARITATYFPTSYGSVTGIVADPGDHPNAEAITLEDREGNITTAYKVDLRDLELRATRARLEAERLARELAEAQLNMQNETADRE